MDSRRLASELGLSGSEHLHACGTGPLALGERTAVGNLCLGPSSLWAATSTLAPRALPLADSAVARLGTAAGRALFLAADDGGPNTDQVLVGHLRTYLGIRQPKRKRVSKE
jgi:hypothetical protein